MKATRREFVKAAGLTTLSSALPAVKSSRPDIVLFMVDQLSAQWAFNQTAVALPNIEKLRRQSVNFTNTCVSNPVCVPSRASLMTGLRTRGHSVLQNGYALNPAIPTFAQQLQKAGWKTAAFGKLHHQPQFSGVHLDYRPYGFDLVHNTEDARAGYWLDWVQQTHPEYYDAALVTVNDGVIPELHAYGPQKVDLSARIAKLRDKYQWTAGGFPSANPDRYTLPFPAYLSQTEWITRHAVDYIATAGRDTPFHAFISYVQPHSPSQPPAEWMKSVDPASLAAPAPIEWVNDPLHPRCFPNTEGAHQTMPADWRSTRHFYMADVAHLDHQLGKVMEALEKTGRLKNTYFLFLSDHGELLLDHGFTGKGERHYDSCVRVPLMISGPGLNQGKEVAELVQLEDIFPTIMEMAQRPLPKPDVKGTFLEGLMPAGAEAYPGRSLLGLCRGEKPDKWRDAVEIESYNNLRSTTPEFWARTVRTPTFRYTLYPGNSGEQLFFLREDPAEQRNLAGDAGYARVRTEMRDRLLESLILEDSPHPAASRYRLGVF
jgi:arylsulfatase A-like enzyme